MISADGMYGLYRELKMMLENPTPGKVKKFMENPFKHFTGFYYNGTNKWNYGVERFVKLANAINSGQFSLNAFCVIFIGYYITQNKFIKQKDIEYIDNIIELNKFYTPFEMKKQMDYINKKIEESVDTDDVFADFTQTKLDIYSVGEDQKNTLYEMIKSGEVNLIHFVIAWHNHKFEVDENKITDKDYYNFIQYMKIIRQNMYKM